MAAQLNINTEKIEKIKTQVQSINDTANAQATTISEIMELLDGKSVPGGGEDVTAEVTAQSTLMDDLEAAVDALPDAGSSGGSSEAIEGYYTYTKEMSAPGAYNYMLTSDELTIDEKKIIIIFAEESIYNYNQNTTTVFKHVICFMYRMNKDVEYEKVTCNTSVTLTAPYDITIEDNKIKLNDISIKSSSDATFNNFCYYAI